MIIKCSSCDIRLKEKDKKEKTIYGQEAVLEDEYLCKKCYCFDEKKWWKKIFKHKFRYVCNCIKCINIKCLKEIINILNKEK